MTHPQDAVPDDDDTEGRKTAADRLVTDAIIEALREIDIYVDAFVLVWAGTDYETGSQRVHISASPESSPVTDIGLVTLLGTYRDSLAACIVRSVTD